MKSKRKGRLMDDKLKELFKSKEYKELQETLERLQKALEIAIKPIQEVMKQFNDITKPMRDAVNEVVDRINKSVLSEEDKQRIKVVAQKLVDNDIVITPEEGPFYFYKFKPTKKNIKALYDSYSSGKRFNDLATLLLFNKDVNQQYCREAIKCYKDKCYLACSSLLLSIIDSHFIAKNKPNNKGERRILTKKLAEDCLNDVEEERNFEYFFLIQSNALLMIGKYYTYGNDFKNEPLNINRNFIDHGMSKRKVTRQDCIKLFVLCSYLEMI